MRSLLFAIPLLILIIFIGGCVQQELSVKNEIRSRQDDMEMVISPSNDSAIKGIVTIKLTQVPEGTNLVAFAIEGSGIEELRKTGPNLGTDNDGSDGWGIELDTTAYPDNPYVIYAFAFPAKLMIDGGPPSGSAQVQVEIQNKGTEKISQPPTEIKFYKAVQFWEPEKNKIRIVEAKDMGANVVVINLFLEYKNGKAVLPNNWKIYLKDSMNEAYRKGLAVSVSTTLPNEISHNLPYKEGSNVDLPSGYNLTSFTENMKEIYGEIAIFAEENKIHSIYIPAEIEVWVGRVFESGNEYWEQSSKIDQGVIKEIRKYYNGEIVGSALGGMWGFDTPCCYTNVPFEKINFKGFDAIEIGTGSDFNYPESVSSLGFVNEGLKRIEFTRNIANLNDVKKIYVDVGGYPGRGDKLSLYNGFFEKSKDKVDGYGVSYLVKLYWKDPESFESAKIWFKKI